MDETILTETFLYGNLELSYSLKQIKQLPIEKIKNIFQKKFLADISFVWRIFKNFRTLFYTWEIEILNNMEKFISIIEFYKSYIDFFEKKFDLKDKFISMKPEKVEEYFKITVYANIKLIHDLISIYKKEKLVRVFGQSFSGYIPFVKNKNIVCSFTSPFEDNIWTPSWRFSYGNDYIEFTSIDIYLDTLFFNPNFRYNWGMRKDVEVLSERIVFLKEHAPNYFDKKILPNLEKVTEKIFTTFPLSIIYSDYPKIIDLEKKVYKTEIYKNSLKKKGVSWALAILPIFLSCYLLGIPVITCDVPHPKNIISSINSIEKDGIEKYFESIYEKNKKKLEIYGFDIPVGNGTEEGEIVDLTFSSVSEYNMDDVITFYNSGVRHIFTTKEFDDLLKKQSNPYNRNKFPLLNRLRENTHFKLKIKRELNARGVNVDLKGTLKENFDEILGEIKKPVSRETDLTNYRADVYQNPLFDFIMNL